MSAVCPEQVALHMQGQGLMPLRLLSTVLLALALQEFHHAPTQVTHLTDDRVQSRRKAALAVFMHFVRTPPISSGPDLSFQISAVFLLPHVHTSICHHCHGPVARDVCDCMSVPKATFAQTCLFEKKLISHRHWAQESGSWP